MSVTIAVMLLWATTASSAVVSAYNNAGKNGHATGMEEEAAASEGTVAALSHEDHWVYAPERFLGDWSKYGGMVFDLHNQLNGRTEPVSVTIVSTDGTRTLDLAGDYQADWQRYSIDLRDEVFPYVSEEHITEVRFQFEKGTEAQNASFFENLDFVPTWRPATAVLALCGVLAILFLQRPLAG